MKQISKSHPCLDIDDEGGCAWTEGLGSGYLGRSARTGQPREMLILTALPDIEYLKLRSSLNLTWVLTSCF